MRDRALRWVEPFRLPPFKPFRQAPADFVLRALLYAVFLLNVVLVAKSIAELLGGAKPIDWFTLVESGNRVRGSGLYDLSPTYLFRWSPVAAWGMIVLAPIGVLGWQLAHVAAVLALRRLRVILPVLLSWPFWADLGNGNTVTFLFVLGALALQGSTGAALGYLGLLLVAPRPLGFPVAAWLLWKRPNLRARFLVMFAVHAGLVAISGWGTAWLRVIGESGVELNNVYNLAPSRLIGALWIPVGLVLALLLAFRNRLGWASLAASPYWFPQYLLMGLFELLKPASPPEAREGE